MDKFITQILAERAKECYMREGSYDGFDKCRQLDDDYEKALTNYFIKCKFVLKQFYIWIVLYYALLPLSLMAFSL